MFNRLTQNGGSIPSSSPQGSNGPGNSGDGDLFFNMNYDLRFQDVDISFTRMGYAEFSKDFNLFYQPGTPNFSGFQNIPVSSFFQKRQTLKMMMSGSNDNASPQSGDDDIDFFEVRQINGSGNNLQHTNYGMTGASFLILSEYNYADGFSTPNDIGRPNVRDISNVLASQSGDIFNHSEMSNLLWVWGQFLDHDINLTREGHEDYAIEVPTGDPYFDPYYTGTQTIGFTRSGYADGTGTGPGNPRLQVNEITAFIDASNVYGSTDEVAAQLRGDDGKLLMSAQDLLPLTNGDHGPEFQAGDVRANENVALTSMHTIFVREHNYWVDQLKIKYPDYDDEQLYQHAKAIVEAEIQHITYDEFLPHLLGENALTDYQGYDATINPQIATEFATAAFRVGHTMLSSNIYRMTEDGSESDYGHLTLQGAFFRPDIIMTQGGIDEIVRGISSSYSQHIDYQIIDDVRNFLFGPPGAGGFDLVSLNIQRGRDHGLADFNTVREAYGLDPIADFFELTGDAHLASKLETLYGDISHLDLWIGGLLEVAHDGALVGETFYTIIADQFTRLRDGDRFWYENRLDEEWIDIIQDTSLSDIMMRNTDIDHMQEDVFLMKKRIGGDDGDNTLHGTASGDLIIGFDGDDIIAGYGGNDVLYGGAGSDTFLFDLLWNGLDIVRDFNVNEDFIDISALIQGYDPLTDLIENFVYTNQTNEGMEVGFIEQTGCGGQMTNVLVMLENVQATDPYQFIITQDV
jgi:hypothetical protein